MDFSHALDLSRVIQPAWDSATTYIRFDDDVIEMPTENTVLYSGLNNESGMAYNPAYSRSSFLLINQGGQYNAYVMTIIGDSSYIKNDPQKLINNKYKKHDADFSGVLLYSTPEGEFINGWFYKEGKISGRLFPNQSTYNDPSVYDTKRTNSLKENMMMALTTCKEWYQWVTVDGVTYGPTYLGTTCTTTYIDLPDPTSGGSGSGTPPPSSGGGGSGGSGGSGGGSTTPTPNPCTPVPASVTNGDNNKLKVMVVQQPDGGYPPPTTPTPNPCVSATEKKEQDLIKELDKNKVLLLPCAVAEAFKTLASYKTPASVNARLDAFNNPALRNKSVIPRSLNALGTFKTVLDERKASGIKDIAGKE
ncbi:hypothetical protein FMM05_13125 [Flavobacterium zepuense]|uniref:Uncharacterized protein n=1 Tax=Flavobacterium zepuense TaxID=2593302 RepID=A0A552UZF9_9FLAO|nr:hypothetical protein [Flavobacterium zepuense]TRW23598.1 hypothetical protein FMM05_13125 [Flavobacterium zepuense]